MVSAAVVVDYQNVHLTAHGQFCSRGSQVFECLIHPLHFANQVIAARRNARVLAGRDAEPSQVELGAVHVFRGLPGNKQQPNFYRRNLAQQSEWTRDRRVNVEYRPLRYTYDELGNWTAEEKGVDVRIALEVARLVESREHEVVILAAHDTDQEPTISYALDSAAGRAGAVTIETTGWVNCKQLRISGRPTWHTFLARASFERSIDRKDYR